MKRLLIYFKYLLVFVVVLSISRLVYVYSFSPSVTVINRTEQTLRLYKVEYDRNTVELEYDEIRNMQASKEILEFDDRSSLSTRINYLIKGENNNLRFILHKGDGYIDDVLYLQDLEIGDTGFCRYKFYIYLNSIEVDNKGFPWCYKKLKIIKPL